MGATQSLQKAIDDANLKKVIEAVNMGADLKARDKHGRTAVDYAQAKNALTISIYLEIVTVLQVCGSDKRVIDGCLASGHTMLTFASRYNITYLVEELIQRGASPDSVDKNGYTPLLYACEYNYGDIIHLLIQAKADANILNKWAQSPLSFLSSHKNISGVKVLLQAKANPNTPSNTGITPLMRACIDGDLNVVSALMLARADPHVGNSLGETALFAAAERGHKDVVTALLKANVNCDLANNKGITPLLTAVSKGQSSVVELLLKSRADPCVASFDGTTPILAAADSTEARGLFRILVDNKADINYVDPHGETAVLRCANRMDIGSAQVLVDLGASVHIGTYRSTTCLQHLDILGIVVKQFDQRQGYPAVINEGGVSTLYIPSVQPQVQPRPASQPSLALTSSGIAPLPVSFSPMGSPSPLTKTRSIDTSSNFNSVSSNSFPSNNSSKKRASLAFCESFQPIVPSISDQINALTITTTPCTPSTASTISTSSVAIPNDASVPPIPNRRKVPAPSVSTSSPSFSPIPTQSTPSPTPTTPITSSFSYSTSPNPVIKMSKPVMSMPALPLPMPPGQSEPQTLPKPTHIIDFDAPPPPPAEEDDIPPPPCSRKAEPEAELQPSEMCINWRQAEDADTRDAYWYNIVTKETTWDMPECITKNPPPCSCGCDAFSAHRKKPSKCTSCGHHHVTGSMVR